MSTRAYLATLRPSRIREVQAGRNGWTCVDLIDVESGEAVALRGVLERFGVRVRRFPVGQARHLVRALGGEASAPYVVVACHGDGGRMLLPELAEEIERFQPLHGSVGPDELRRARSRRSSSSTSSPRDAPWSRPCRGCATTTASSRCGASSGRDGRASRKRGRDRSGGLGRDRRDAEHHGERLSSVLAPATRCDT